MFKESQRKRREKYLFWLKSATSEIDEPGYQACWKIQEVIDAWVAQVDRAGLKANGLWAVDFDKATAIILEIS